MSSGTYRDLLGATESEEVLYESDRTRVVRVRPAVGDPVIVKEFLGPSAGKRLRHERALLERLTGVEGVLQLAQGRQPDDVLVLVDTGAISLAAAEPAGGLPLADLIEAAPAMARALAAVHARGVVHKDVTPANFVWAAAPPVAAGAATAPGTGEAGIWLIDFDLAGTFAVERPAFTHQSEITGTLAYLAPEQTGRTGRPVDQRADLYGLGATLYHLATGAPMFEDDDPLQAVHDHLARVPDPPHERNPLLPRSLSDIIMRLLEKEPDRRYQSAEGLAHDLTRLREAVRAGRPAEFALAERDFPLRLAPPVRVVGRDDDVAALRSALEGALTGGSRGVLISGEAGTGKSMLLDELRPMVTEAGGWFVSGTGGQYRQEVESDAVHQALSSLGRLMLAESEERLERLRVHQFLQGVGTHNG